MSAAEPAEPASTAGSSSAAAKIAKAAAFVPSPLSHVMPHVGAPSTIDSETEKDGMEASENAYKTPSPRLALQKPLQGSMSSKAGAEHYDPMLNEKVVHSTVPEELTEEFPILPGELHPKKFEKLKLLGQGAVGKVYLVYLKEHNKLYAMKVLTKEEMIKKRRVKHVMTEREILATVNHPFIISMYASFQTSTRLCIIMEYAQGGEFFRILQTLPKKRLPEAATMFYAAEVILALEYLHHLGFIYRDLKPENILMRKSGHIALTDFDLSLQGEAMAPLCVVRPNRLIDRVKAGSFSLKRAGSGSKLSTMDIVDQEPRMLVQSRSFVGTEEYLAPEVVKHQVQSSAVDWWTLGILIYEMMTGSTPFKGRSSNQTLKNITGTDIHWPSDVRASNHVKDLVRKLLQRDPERRLGRREGASEIKREKWFVHHKMNFDLIRNQLPPILPKMRDPYDMTQYNLDSMKFDDDDDDSDEDSFRGPHNLQRSNSDPSRPSQLLDDHGQYTSALVEDIEAMMNSEHPVEKIETPTHASATRSKSKSHEPGGKSHAYDPFEAFSLTKLQSDLGRKY
ncbi:Serine/threonine-protein kinase nrc-2 [Porphyridium purpureum]|uniref:non-specific serine/threonine protein kinase n=1 Tax=Porphyridium purpureum TaxID=35688 RepID=A0A5J4YYY8_PORPP|nr:Serine/threonine-protein kinase nrc-2 [Porphyridium purpureum]|eukprot:POR2624..scf208_2